MAFRTVKSSGKAPPLSSSVTSLRGLERLNCDFCYAILGSKYAIFNPKIATLTCHAYRVMYVAVSPDGKTIVTRARDETLRFWNVFPSMKTQSLYAERGNAVG
uniref:Uncharacterized protein n=1 Tax=Brassica oleracea var. oleracea TaxID=109376 RepID=A0A0D3C440_BRAOL